jgi:hypothetical protein
MIPPCFHILSNVHDIILNFFVSIRLFLTSNLFSICFFALIVDIYIASNRP